MSEKAILAVVKEGASTASENALLLLREADHRVTNSLQLLSSLLRLQERTLDDGPAREALVDAGRRVRGIARLHRTLCSTAGSDAVSLEDYLTSLSDDLWDTFLEGRRIQLLVNVDAAKISPKLACSIGLAVNELVTNAIKHGFGEDGVGTIEINGGVDKNGNIQIDIKNDAIARRPVPVVSLDGCHGLGMKIVNAALAQHDGSLETLVQERIMVQRIVLPVA